MDVAFFVRRVRAALVLTMLKNTQPGDIMKRIQLYTIVTATLYVLSMAVFQPEQPGETSNTGNTNGKTGPPQEPALPDARDAEPAATAPRLPQIRKLSTPYGTKLVWI